MGDEDGALHSTPTSPHAAHPMEMLGDTALPLSHPSSQVTHPHKTGERTGEGEHYGANTAALWHAPCSESPPWHARAGQSAARNLHMLVP